MDILAVIEALRAHSFPFRLLQSEFKAQQMPSAQSWEPLLKKYEDTSAWDQRDLATLAKALTTLYVNHLRYGTKAVVMFHMAVGVTGQLLGGIAALDNGDSPFRVPYPLPLMGDSLKNTSFSSVLTACETEEDSNDVRLVFCAKRAVKIRETLEAASLEPAFRSSLGERDEIDEVIIVRNRLIQSFDSVIIRPNDHRVEIHIDMSEPLNASDILRLIGKYTNKINELFPAISGLSLAEPMNFFPCIGRLYDESDGYIHQLGHATGTASIKDEKMRRKGQDLREESCHEKGLEAVGGFTNSYAITKGWPTDHLGNPQLTIAGRFSQAGASNASVIYAIIDGCTCKQDFDRLLAKLL
jgi:hypothetical protein